MGRLRLAGRVLAAAGLLAAGCARPGAPPGGPPDTTSPEVASVSPESLAVDVPLDAPIRIVFTEKVDPTTLEKAIWVTPGGLSKPQIHVSGETVTIRSRRPFPDSTTVGVLVTTGVRDRHQNQILKPARWVFSTGDSVWPGSVKGRAELVGSERSRGAHLLIGLYPGGADTLPDPRTTSPLAITEADTAGMFNLIGLPADGKLRWLFGLFDRDGNREISGAGEFVGANPESVVLTSAYPHQTIPLRVINPQAPATLQGKLARAEGDTVRVWLELYAENADSTAKPVSRTEAATSGTFSFRQVPPGAYRLFAFCDADGDGKREESEAAAAYGRVELPPGETRELGAWDGPRCVP